MEGLLAEINAKRKALEIEAGPSDGPAKKYMRRADIEKAREEEERKKRMEDAVRKEALKAEGKAYKARKEAEQARNSSLAKLAVSSPGGSSRNTPDPGRTDSPAPAGESFNISPEECIRRLRAKGQPIRLFGESDKDRRLRLRALELLEEKGGGGSGLNDFRKTLANMESSMDEKEAGKLARLTHEKAAAEASKQQSSTEDGPAEEGKETSGKSKDKMKGMEVALIDLKLVKSDPNKLYPLIYYALKNVLKEWEEWMDARPVEIKRTTAGKLAAATQVDSAQNLKPLFRLLRKRDLPADVLRNLAEIVHHMQNRSYQKANDAYLRMSIGNAAWPIGVTSVGIHERSAREKIGQDNIAHALNSEENRKYIQAVKRLLTFSQTVRPPSEISQLMG